MITAAYFFLGAIFGSFLNVLAVRYREDKFIVSREVLFGRSACLGCGTTLRWYELIPFFSFVLQGGRCRTCKARISPRYPIVEALTGLIFVLTASKLAAVCTLLQISCASHIVLWLMAFSTLFLIAMIDLRLGIIPDELTILIFLLGGAWQFIDAPLFETPYGSFLGSYALIFGVHMNIFLNHIIGALAGFGFFMALTFMTRGRGIGFGDVKLAGALGFLFGWPDILLVLLLSFVLGSIVGLVLILKERKTLKSAIPFGPFLALGSYMAFLLGEHILRFYFGIFPL